MYKNLRFVTSNLHYVSKKFYILGEDSVYKYIFKASTKKIIEICGMCVNWSKESLPSSRCGRCLKVIQPQTALNSPCGGTLKKSYVWIFFDFVHFFQSC